jgi:tetratricopeptide (TPR) repeat protein
MKKTIYCLLFVLLVSNLSAQNNTSRANELIRQGIASHDNGDYAKAIEYYTQALEETPDDPVIYYEMAFSYLYAENYEKTLECAEKGISFAEGQRDMLPGLYDLKASALDDLGRPEEAAALYIETIRRFGAESTLLYYNLGLTYYRMNNKAGARDAIISNLGINPNHPSSNFLLGKILFDENKKSQSLYCLYYFILLEPNTERSIEARDMIEDILAQGTEIQIESSGDYMAFDLIISIAGVSNEENQGLNEDELFLRKTRSIFTIFGELLSSGDKIPEGIWKDHLFPFFYRIAQSEHLETFCHYTSFASSKESEAWLYQNRDKVDDFFDWLDE